MAEKQSVGRPRTRDDGEIKVNMRLNGEPREMFLELRQMMSPVVPEEMPTTAVLAYCIRAAHKAAFGARQD